MTKTTYLVTFRWLDTDGHTYTQQHDTREEAIAAANAMLAEQTDRAQSFDPKSVGQLCVTVEEYTHTANIFTAHA